MLLVSSPCVFHDRHDSLAVTRCRRERFRMEAVAGSPVQARSPASGGEDASRQTSIASAPALVVAVRVLCVVSATVKDEPTPRSRASKPASPAPASSVPFLEVANEVCTMKSVANLLWLAHRATECVLWFSPADDHPSADELR